MTIQNFTPVTTLQRNYVSAIKDTENGPVILSQHSKPVAVLLSVSTYEQLIADAEEGKRARREQKADQVAVRMDAGDYTEFSPEELAELCQ
jgi:prevent-host-death family protein